MKKHDHAKRKESPEQRKSATFELVLYTLACLWYSQSTPNSLRKLSQVRLATPLGTIVSTQMRHQKVGKVLIRRVCKNHDIDLPRQYYLRQNDGRRICYIHGIFTDALAEGGPEEAQVKVGEYLRRRKHNRNGKFKLSENLNRRILRLQLNQDFLFERQLNSYHSIHNTLAPHLYYARFTIVLLASRKVLDRQVWPASNNSSH